MPILTQIKRAKKYLQKTAKFKICLNLIRIKRLRKGFNLWKMSRYWILKDTGASYEKKFASTDNHGRNIQLKVENQLKLDSCKKFWYLLFDIFSITNAKISFVEETLGTRYPKVP